MPVWKGFGASAFSPALNPAPGQPYRYAADGFEATHYDLATDQFGTQLDPPAHWAHEYPAIDELPATYAVRPLVVISIVKQVAAKPDYALQVSDVRAWERKYGRIQAGSVVMVRSDWSHKWTGDSVAAKLLAADPVFPGVGLDALKLLHRKRHILLHGHEPLDTDSTPTLEGEDWLMHHGYTQAEGVDRLDRVPATGCLVSIGYAEFKGGTGGGYARYVAICPPGSTARGTRISSADAPLPKPGGHAALGRGDRHAGALTGAAPPAWTMVRAAMSNGLDLSRGGEARARPSVSRRRSQCPSFVVSSRWRSLPPRSS